MAMATSCRSATGASSAIVMRKSFFAPCSLTKGIFIRAFVYFDHGPAFYRNALHEFVTGAVQARFIEHGLNFIAAFHDSPIGVEKKVGPRHRRVPFQIVIACQGIAKRDAQGP